MIDKAVKDMADMAKTKDMGKRTGETCEQDGTYMAWRHVDGSPLQPGLHLLKHKMKVGNIFPQSPAGKDAWWKLLRMDKFEEEVRRASSGKT